MNAALGNRLDGYRGVLPRLRLSSDRRAEVLRLAEKQRLASALRASERAPLLALLARVAAVGGRSVADLVDADGPAVPADLRAELRQMFVVIARDEGFERDAIGRALGGVSPGTVARLENSGRARLRFDDNEGPSHE